MGSTMNDWTRVDERCPTTDVLTDAQIVDDLNQEEEEEQEEQEEQETQEKREGQEKHEDPVKVTPSKALSMLDSLQDFFYSGYVTEEVQSALTVLKNELHMRAIDSKPRQSSMDNFVLRK